MHFYRIDLIEMKAKHELDKKDGLVLFNRPVLYSELLLLSAHAQFIITQSSRYKLSKENLWRT